MAEAPYQSRPDIDRLPYEPPELEKRGALFPVACPWCGESPVSYWEEVEAEHVVLGVRADGCVVITEQSVCGGQFAHLMCDTCHHQWAVLADVERR